MCIDGIDPANLPKGRRGYERVDRPAATSRALHGFRNNQCARRADEPSSSPESACSACLLDLRGDVAARRS